MRRRRLLACGLALGLLGAGPPAPISLRTLEGAEQRIQRGESGPDGSCTSGPPGAASARGAAGARARAQGCDPARVQVIAVNVAEEPEVVRQYMTEKSVALPVLLILAESLARRRPVGPAGQLVWTGGGVRTRDGASAPSNGAGDLVALGCAGPCLVRIDELAPSDALYLESRARNTGCAR